MPLIQPSGPAGGGDVSVGRRHRLSGTPQRSAKAKLMLSKQQVK